MKFVPGRYYTPSPTTEPHWYVVAVIDDMRLVAIPVWSDSSSRDAWSNMPRKVYVGGLFSEWIDVTDRYRRSVAASWRALIDI